MRLKVATVGEMQESGGGDRGRAAHQRAALPEQLAGVVGVDQLLADAQEVAGGSQDHVGATAQPRLGFDGDDAQALGLTLVLSFIAVGGLLLMQGVQVLPQMMLPVWFVWSLAENWLRQTSEARQLSYAYAPANFYPAADFQ